MGSSSGFRLACFEIRDETGSTLLGSVPLDLPEGNASKNVQLSSDYLKCRVVSSRIQFQVGGEALAALRMIERHFLQGQLLRTFDTVLGFGIPDTLNTHEAHATTHPLPARY